MPKLSAVLTLLLTVSPNGAFGWLCSKLLNVFPVDWSVLSVLPVVGAIHATSRPKAPSEDRQRFRLRQQLLVALKNEVATRLQQSLHNAVRINLLKEQELQLVRPDVDVKIGVGERFALNPEDSIAKVFDDAGGKLLILGAPGAGKTTILLELAEVWGDRAQNDALAPAPVLLHLSSWKDDNQSIADWLVAEIKSKYKVDIDRQWLVNGQLLLLLDGLDELPRDRQEKCIQAINQLLVGDSPPLQIVVCTRYNEYLNCQSKLRLNGAILLRPLNETQIRQYLVGARSRELWYNIETEPHLLALAQTPLLLSMMTLAYEEILIHSWKRLISKEDLRQYLFNAYIRCQMGREIKQRRQPTPERTRHWLIWLAKRMEEENQTEFSIEKMPLDWLQTPSGKRQYRIGVVLMGGFIPGLAFVRQFVLRFVLWRCGYIPWNYRRFLGLAAERLFLQKVGDRYRFIHRCLQEHFAQMPLDL